MKIEAGKTYVDGYDRKVRIVCTDRKSSSNAPLCIGLVDTGGKEGIYSYYHDGKYDANYDPKLNLVKEYKELSYSWVNVYVGGRTSHAFISREYADRALQTCIEIWGNTQGKRIGLLKIDCETGQSENIKLEA